MNNQPRCNYVVNAVHCIVRSVVANVVRSMLYIWAVSSILIFVSRSGNIIYLKMNT